MIKTITAKLGNMRKTVEWVIYPLDPKAPNLIIIQSDKRIARIDIEKDIAFLSDGKHGNSFLSLSPQLGAKLVEVSVSLVDVLRQTLGTGEGYTSSVSVIS